MNLLDENIRDDQQVLLQRWRIPFRQIGGESASWRGGLLAGGERAARFCEVELKCEIPAHERKAWEQDGNGGQRNRTDS